MTIMDSKMDWDVKLMTTLWTYLVRLIVYGKVTTQANPFSLVYGLEATHPH